VTNFLRVTKASIDQIVGYIYPDFGVGRAIRRADRSLADPELDLHRSGQ
jgi:hypothetical protein